MAVARRQGGEVGGGEVGAVSRSDRQCQQFACSTAASFQWACQMRWLSCGVSCRTRWAGPPRCASCVAASMPVCPRLSQSVRMGWMALQVIDYAIRQLSV
eukprot:354647-Chlamydomonas_euryale.AAC.4